MSGVDTRHIDRDSLFLLAELRLEDQQVEHRVKVRNLSAGGMMAEGSIAVTRGARLSVNLRNIGWVDGAVAWVQDERFGIAFVREIDPRLARAMPTAGAPVEAPRFTRPIGALPPSAIVDQSRLRKL